MRGVTCVLGDILEMLKESGVTSLIGSFNHLKIYNVDIEKELEKLKITKDTARKIDMNTADCAWLKAQFQALIIDRELNAEKIAECEQKINEVEQKYAELSDEQRRSNQAYQAEIAEINRTYKVEISVLYGKIEKQNEVIAQLQDMLQRGYEDAEKAAKSVNQELIEEIQKLKHDIRDIQNEREYRKDVYSSQMQDDTVIIPEFEVVAVSASSIEIKEEEKGKRKINIDDFVIEKGVLKEYKGKGGDIVVPSSVKEIGDRAFSECWGLTSIAFTRDSELTIIGENAFSECSGLTSIEIPSSVQRIEDEAFYNCSSLTSITIPSKVSFIGWRVLSGCSGLKRITVASGNNAYHSNGNCLIETDSKELLAGCNSSIIPLDGSVTSIADGAFSECSGLTSIEIPSSVVSIYGDPFYQCTRLTIYCEESTKPSGWDSQWNISGCPVVWNCKSNDKDEDGFAYSTIDKVKYILKDGEASVIRQSPNLSGKIIIPSNVIYDDKEYSVTSIWEQAFCECSELTSIEIPSSVTSIGEHVFTACSALESITVLSGNRVYHSSGNCLIESDRKALIAGCKNSVIPSDGSVTSIDQFAFHSCSGLAKIAIPNIIEKIGFRAFYGCSGLESIIVASGNNIYHSSGNCLIETSRKVLITGCKNSIIPSDGSVTIIGGGAFIDCKGLSNISIPSSITDICLRAFFNCSDLTSILYEGTRKQWKKISHPDLFSWNMSFTVHCSDGDIVETR